MKSFYPYNSLIAWQFRNFLDIEDFLPPILSVLTVVIINGCLRWLMQKPQNNLFFCVGAFLWRFHCCDTR